MSTEDDRPLMTSAEVAALFRVEPKTVTRWAREGKLPSIPTPGGHPRFIESEIRAIIARIPLTSSPGAALTTPPPGEDSIPHQEG